MLLTGISLGIGYIHLSCLTEIFKWLSNFCGYNRMGAKALVGKFHSMQRLVLYKRREFAYSNAQFQSSCLELPQDTSEVRNNAALSTSDSSAPTIGSIVLWNSAITVGAT